MNNIDERLTVISQATKLWNGLEKQKEWCKDCPAIMKTIERAITDLQLEIIIMCQPDEILEVLQQKIVPTETMKQYIDRVK